MNPPDPLPELLSKRELEILALLVENKTNQEIADLLHLALSSVKWYAGEIYGKLGVENRKQAVQKAANLGLLGNPAQEVQKPSLPSGMVTFLFTDIEGSTALWEQMPEAMQESIKQHHTILRQAIEGNGGHVFQVVGDAFQAAFRLASDGLFAALAAQHALQDTHWGPTGPLKVRMGLHTGPAELDSGSDAPYQVGHTLNRVARVMSAGYGGQILLSQEGADLVERELPEGISLLDLGQHHLKGMQRIEHLYQVIAPDLPHHFPPLPTGVVHPHNLPTQLTSFIGREKELAALEDLFLSRAARLVTLTGSGGTGKTRLALKAAEALLELFSQGVWLVELAPISDPLLVPRAVAEALNVREGSPENLVQAISAYIRNRQMLLILDNCEHVVSAAAALAAELLQGCPQLHILATSREILGIAGETPYRVPSLSLPKGKLPVADLAQYEAVRLFVERAQPLSPGFALTESSAALVAQICQRLDGIPLAIELAAARTRMLSLDQIASRLDQAFRLLTGGSRSALPRQQTLRALIDWSYNLLSEPERLLLQRLSVFAGGWTLEAAESVCTDGTLLPAEQILDLLGQLIDKSLIQIEQEQTEEPRYRMLETVRQYAHERLVESGDAADLREHHLDHFLDEAVRIEPSLRSRQMRHFLNILDRELDNLRLALEWSLSGSISKGLTLATVLRWYWQFCDHQWEGIEWMEKLLAKDDEISSLHPREETGWIARGRALYTVNLLRSFVYEDDPVLTSKRGLESKAIFQKLYDTQPNPQKRAFQHDVALATFSITWENLLESRKTFESLQSLFYQAECDLYLCAACLGNYDLDHAEFFNDEHLRLRQKIGDLDGEGFALFLSAYISLCRGRLTEVVELAKRSLAYQEEAGDLTATEFPLSILRRSLLVQGDYQQIQERIEIDRNHGHELNSPFKSLNLQSYEGYVAWAYQDYERAVLYSNKALEMTSHLPLHWQKQSIYVLGRVALSRGEYSLAREYLLKTLAKSFTHLFFDFSAFQALGVLAAAQHRYRRAATLFGAQIGIAAWTLNVMCPAERSEYEHALTATRAGLGEEAFTIAWNEGKAMTEEQLRQYIHQEG